MFALARVMPQTQTRNLADRPGQFVPKPDGFNEDLVNIAAGWKRAGEATVRNFAWGLSTALNLTEQGARLVLLRG